MDKILVVDDNPDNLELVGHLLSSQGIKSEVATSGKEALSKLETRQFPLVLTDLMMPHMNGIQLLEKIKGTWPETQVMIITAHGSIKTAIEAIKKGAYSYILKPFEPDDFRLEIDKALGFIRVKRENSALKLELDQVRHSNVMIGASPQMMAIQELIKSVANTAATVLITGESGTGKELVANAIHNSSDRKNGAFVKVNCAALAETLLESELFGHEKGAFTGAVAQKKGRFELAHGGTIFLDEIGEVSPALQVKLLRVLQEREFERVGGTKPVRTDVRVISATNRNLEQAVKDGQFREDLYYRLNVIPIRIPALRERKNDIPDLVIYFLDKYGEDLHRPGLVFSDGAQRSLMDYAWPGNIRELQNVVERAVVLSPGTVIGEMDLPENIRMAGAGMSTLDGAGLHSFKAAKRQFEKQFIQKALTVNFGNISRTAEMIQLARKNLQDKIKLYGIDVAGLTDEAREAGKTAV